MLRPWQRTTLAILNVVPVPGVGAAVAGYRNPHTRLLRNGLLQAALFLLGAWPLILPGAIALGWAVWDAVRIHQASLFAPPPTPAEGSTRVP